jgi:hypothetical protein
VKVLHISNVKTVPMIMVKLGLIGFFLLLSAALAAANTTSTLCNNEELPFNPFRHKEVYKVGVHAIRGLDAAFAESNMTFATYLSETAGRR